MKTAIKINGKPVEVPSLEELTFGQFLSIQKANNDAEVLSITTGLDIDTCNQVDSESVLIILSPLLNSLKCDFQDVDADYICGEIVPEKIGKKECARKFNCDNAMKKTKDFELLGKIVSIYCAPGIEDEHIAAFEKKVNDELFLKVISAGRNLVNQLEGLAKSEKKIKEPEYESEEVSAGIKEFRKYGVYGLVRSIALKYGKNLDQIYNWSYNDILMELKISAEESSYQRKLMKLLRRTK